MTEKVKILKVIDIGGSKCQVEYDVKDEDYTHSDFNPNDPNIHQIYRGSFTCNYKDIQNTLRKEVKEALPKYLGIELKLPKTEFEVSEL